MCKKAAYCDNAGASRRINNEVHFFSGKGIKLMRGILSLDSETLRFEEIQPSQAKYSSSYTVIGIGADGKACIGQDGKSAVYILKTLAMKKSVFPAGKPETGMIFFRRIKMMAHSIMS